MSSGSDFACVDATGLYERELKDWLPPAIFDAHLHLGRKEDVGAISAERKKQALTYFSHLSYEDVMKIYARLFPDQGIAGMIVFGFPLQEVKIESANNYTAELMRREQRVKGFILCNPARVMEMVGQFRAWEKRGVRFCGVKPYYDFLGKSNYETDWNELLPESLLDFLNSEELIVMLHTCRTGMGERQAQRFIADVVERFPRITIILAHMGRYLQVEPALEFFTSDLLNCPSIYLETSSASVPEVYDTVLSRRILWDRLLFGTDIPYGTWNGVEQWSAETGPVFLTRETVTMHPEWCRLFGVNPEQLTFNTYHVIEAIKQAVEGLCLSAAEQGKLIEKIFLTNAQRLFE